MVNFLAHIFLSGDDEGLIIGNYIGDEVKGNKWNSLDPDIARGVLMHRQIDHYTDSHPVCRASAKQIRPYFGKWSGVAIDLYWDHFLAKTWDDHHEIPLPKFTSDLYGFLKANKEKLPQPSRHMLQYMSQYDWLTNYSTVPGIGKSFVGLSRRVGRENSLHRGEEVLEREYPFLEEHFQRFFSDIKTASKQWKNLRKPL